MYSSVLRVPTNDDEVSYVNTEDSLISSRTSTETVNSDKKAVECYLSKRSRKLGHIWLIVGIASMLWGTGMLIYTPYDLLMDLRIHMMPGLPPFDWWLHPPDEVLLKVYIFNVTNSEEFLNGTDAKLKLEEIGPIIYREKLRHTNPIFNENGTLTYTANRSAIYLPELNTIDLNQTIIMPNLAVLFIPSYFYNAPFYVKMGINMMMHTSKSSPFVKTTIQNYLWNETDPILDVCQKLAPALVPTKNVGILDRIYSNFEDNVTVYIGPTFDHNRFFLIDKYDGSEWIPNRGSRCHDKVVNSSEGVSYPQFLTKNDTLRYWRKTLCKVGKLDYEREIEKYGVTAYKYTLVPTTYDRTAPEEDDCYKGEPALPNGLSDVSVCYFDTAIAASFPHYLYGDDVIQNYVEGLKPDMEKHESYVIVEPNTGIPLHGIARSQINLVMKNMRGFNEKMQRFSDMSIPLVWLEYNQVGIPWYIEWLIYFTVVLVPILQMLFTIFLFLMSTTFICYYAFIRIRSKNNLLENKKLHFESEIFLKT
nr:unnamed protein product [Callosobruchus analis]